jgi:hypothetical protein
MPRALRQDATVGDDGPRGQPGLLSEIVGEDAQDPLSCMVAVVRIKR